jgi:hypothetical protein
MLETEAAESRLRIKTNCALWLLCRAQHNCHLWISSVRGSAVACRPSDSWISFNNGCSLVSGISSAL